MKERIGTNLKRCLLIELLGEGDLVTVFKAHDEIFRHFVAISKSGSSTCNQDNT